MGKQGVTFPGSSKPEHQYSKFALCINRILGSEGKSFWSITDSGRGRRRDGQERGQVGSGGSGQNAGRDDQGEDGELGDDRLEGEREIREGREQRGVTGKAPKNTRTIPLEFQGFSPWRR